MSGWIKVLNGIAALVWYLIAVYRYYTNKDWQFPAFLALYSALCAWL